MATYLARVEILRAGKFGRTDKKMNDEKIDRIETQGITAEKPSNHKPLVIGGAFLALLNCWCGYLFWPGAGGQAVPTPKTVTFGGSDPETSMPAGEQTLTIPAEQVERAGIKIDSVGETMSAEAQSVAATGVVQANGYRETPVISLLGGVVRRVNVELGQSVSKGQTVAVVFSDELAAAQCGILLWRPRLPPQTSLRSCGKARRTQSGKPGRT